MASGLFSFNATEYIDTGLSALYKSMFNGYVINPTEDNLLIVNRAIALLDGKEEFSPQSSEISFFRTTWLEKIDNEGSKKELEKLLQNLKCQIEHRILYLKFVKDEHNSQEAYDWKQVQQQKVIFMAVVRRGLSEKRLEINKETIKEANKFFNLHLQKVSLGQMLYDVICDDEVADFYFLRCQGDFSRKAEFIIQCLKHDDFDRAEQLVERIVKTTTYPDFYDVTDSTGRWRGYSWERDATNIMAGVLREVNSALNCSYNPPPSLAEIYEVKKLVMMVFPYLKKSARQSIRSEFAMLYYDDANARRKYMDALFEDLKYYTGNLHSCKNSDVGDINSISEELLGAFGVLDKMREPDALAKMLTILCESDCIPVKYSTFVDRCILSVSDEMMIFLIEKKPELIQRWLSDSPSKRGIDAFLKIIQRSKNKSLIEMSSLLKEKN